MLMLPALDESRAGENNGLPIDLLSVNDPC